MNSITKDVQTTVSDGTPLIKLPQDVIIKDVYTHVDARGTVFEVYNPQWGWHKEPIVFGHVFTIRPGVAKGWAMHKRHEDRYCMLFGEVELVLYDDRPRSPTRGLVSIIPMTEYRRILINIPPGIWHASHNIVQENVAILDVPTRPYDHANPDKYRLPLNTKKIPYSFTGLKGW